MMTRERSTTIIGVGNVRNRVSLRKRIANGKRELVGGDANVVGLQHGDVEEG